MSLQDKFGEEGALFIKSTAVAIVIAAVWVAITIIQIKNN